MNKLVKPLILIVVILAVLTLGKNFVAKASAEAVCRAITGLQLKIGGLDLSLLRSSLTMNNIKLYNPAGYPDRIMFDVPEVYGRIERASITGGKPHLYEVRLHLKELLVEKNKDGKLNVMALKPQEKKDASGKPAGGKAPQVTIDVFTLRVDKVVYKDFSGGGQPRVQEFNVNLNETYRGITNINALVPLIVQKAIMNTTISSLANLNMNDLVSNFSAAGVNMGSLGVEKLSALSGDLAATGTGLVSGLSKNGTQEAGKVADSASKAVGGLFKAIADQTK